MFPPSDSHSQENSPEAYPDTNGGSGGAGTATVDDRRSTDLVPFNGGMMAPGGPWSIGPSRPEILTATPTFSNLLHALRRRLWLAVFTGLILGSGLGYLCWRLMPTKYESVSTLEIRAENPSVWVHPEGGVDFATYKFDAMSALKSDIVIAKVLDDKTVQNLPVIREHGLDAGAWLADNIVADNPLGSEYVRVSLRYEDPHGLPDIVNALVNAYMDEVVNKERTEKLARRDSLDKKLQQYRNDLSTKRTSYHDLSNQMQAPDAASAKTQYLIQNGELQAAIQARWEAKRQFDEVVMEIEMTQATAAGAQAGMLSEQDVQDAYAHDPQDRCAPGRDLEALQRQEREIKQIVRGNAPELKKIHDLIRELRDQVEQYQTADRNQLIEGIKRNADANGVKQKGARGPKGFLPKSVDRGR